MSRVINVGDTVRYRPAFGMGSPRNAVVEQMELTERPHMKDGDCVESVTIEQVQADRVIFCLGDGHWAYGCQIVGVVGS